MSWTLTLTDTVRPSLIEGGPGCLSVLAEWARGVEEQRRRLVVLGDARVLDLWGTRILAALGDDELPVLRVPPGEPSKDAAHAFAAWEWLAAQRVRRDDVLVAVGGGVVGDLGGFVAATYLRGVLLWQIPTTLLAQVDSSVGGKVAINLAAGKNLVGAFYQADRVLIDPEVLTTLPEQEYAGGLGEVVKYGLLDEHDLLGYLESHAAEIRARDPQVLADIVKRCVALKAEVVQEDELDRGRRAVLNLGHTAGHALEVGLGYGAIPHGIAVGLGLLVALAVSERAVGTDPQLRLRVGALLEELGLPSVAAVPEEGVLLEASAHDKKVTAAGRGFVCLRSPGDPVWGVDVSTEDFLRAFEAIRR